MNGYTIYCSEEQTLKAIELGAPIEIIKYDSTIIKTVITFGGFAIVPTAEQMIGWLEEQGLSFHIMQPYNNKTDFWLFLIRPSFEKGTNFSSRKEATLAAIDAALDYLSKNKT